MGSKGLIQTVIVCEPCDYNLRRKYHVFFNIFAIKVAQAYEALFHKHYYNFLNKSVADPDQGFPGEG